YRAYFQGRSLLAPGALAQTCEAAAKLLAGTAVVWVLFKRGYSPAVLAAGAAFGVTAGTAVAALTLRIRVFREGSLRKTLPEKDVGKRLLWESLPISAGVLAMNIIGALDAAVILNRLAFCGNSAREATSLYGVYTGYAVTVYAMPFALTGAVTAWAAPRVAGAFATGRFAAVTASLRTALRLCAGVGAFAGFCYLLMPGELLGIFFSKAEAASASPLLALLSVSVFVCPLSSVISSALQSMGKTKIPLISGIVSGGVKLVLNYVLIGIPEIGILGAPISAAASFLLSFAFCGAALSKQLKSAGERVRFLRRCAMPFFCGLMGAVSARALCGALTGCLSERFAAASAVVSGCGVFFIFALMTGVITRRELGIFGAGKKGERLDDNENREIHYG
ncbi:MAG: polysaccharide biosynthesis C-terminal domain-containing protein, partial [Clostridia bacterium]|nr:polysaccharide biosynthesis C-terminal domain-containing protein [Clostridia bacterium]